MNITDFDCYCNKLNVLMEIKVFKKLEKVHKITNHESKDVFSCPECCLMCDQIMEEYLYQNREQKQIQETIKDLEQKEFHLKSRTVIDV